MASPRDGLPVPTLAGSPVVGCLREVRRDYLGTISRAAREVGGLARIVAGPPGWRVVLYSVASPSLAAEVLGQPDRFRKQAPGYRELRQALGDNLLTSEDEVWHRQRRFLAPLFTRRRILTDYAPVMVGEAERLVARLRVAAAAGTILDAYALMVEVASRISGRILLGTDITPAVGLLQRFRTINDQLLGRAVSPHPVPARIPTPANRRLSRGLGEVRRIVDDLITDRRANDPSSVGTDLLSLLLRAHDAANPADRLSDTEIRDQATLFLLAGHDTTAVTLACTLVHLALAPEWQRRVQDEIDAAVHDSSPTATDLDRLPWLGRVVHEAMRLSPAAHGIARSTRDDQVLGGYRIPARSWVEVSPWGVHHSPAVWPEPGRFDPRRFDVGPGELPGGHRYAWIPFGTGPRACVGMQIGLLEVQLVIAAVLQHFTITTPLTALPVHAAITLVPTGALPVRFQPR
ncbi:MAG: cytochrome [Friedmanniella sp.]|nr:cytochrome [Friedmanniella sp.]